MAVKEAMNKFEAGQLIQARREALGYTQTDVVENTTITVETYVSELENGKVSVGRSKHFPSLAHFLKLSEDDIRAISPNAVFATVENDEVAPVPPRPIPPALAEAARQRGGEFATPAWQDYLSRMRFRGNRPETPDDWYDLYRDLSRHGIVPGGN